MELTMPVVSPVYAALAAVLLVVLALRVALRRGAAQVGLGDGGDAELVRRVRAHGNAAEHLPIALLLLVLLELGGLGAVWLHGFGAVLLAARVAHAVGVSGSAGRSPGRFWGTLGTWLLLLAMAGVLLLRASGLASS